MKILRLALAALLAGSMLVSEAKNDINNPMTQAVLRVYEQQLAANPSDYNTRFRRANEYYRHNDFIRALDDVNRALADTPRTDKDMRYQELILRAGILQQLGRYQEALADFNSIIEMEPQSYVAYYQRGNTLYELGRYQEAKADYQTMERLNGRSAEAYLGLARIAVKENNLGMANDYLARAVELNPNSAETYVRRAAVRKQMGNHNGAVDDLILALSCDSRHQKAINELVDYGNTNYAAVINGLTTAIEQAPRVGMYLYIRAVIAQAHYNYGAAIADYQKIIDDRLYNYPGLNASIAECQFDLGRYDLALESINEALAQSTNDANYFILKSKILRALGRHEEAVDVAARAIATNSESAPAMAEMALAYVGVGNYKEATALLGEAMLTDAEDARYPMLRAWVLEEYMNQPKAAAQFYHQVADMHADDDYNIHTLRGFALLFLDRTDEADRWINLVLANSDDPDGLVHYYAACYYTAQDDFDRGIEMAKISLERGYADYQRWMEDTDGRINVAPLRDDLRFLNLINRYNHIFDR